MSWKLARNGAIQRRAGGNFAEWEGWDWISDFGDAIARAYEGAACISFEGMQYRRDIGARALASGPPVA